jgi:putative selenate reductase
VNHRAAVAAVSTADRYTSAKTSKPPRKIGSHLKLFDCINCDKCVPVCPNDANFVYETPPASIPYRDLVVRGGSLVPGELRTLSLGGPEGSSHQIANWADACNDCGNCDVFCPEDGGPYIEKPRIFESVGAYLADAPRPGFFVRKNGGGTVEARGRWGGREVELSVGPDGSADFWDGVAELRFESAGDSEPSEARIFAIPAPEGHVVPVGHYHALRALVAGLFAAGAVSWVTAMAPLTAATGDEP